MIRVYHAGRFTEHTLFIIGLDLCAFEVLLEGGDFSVQDIVGMIHLVSLDHPVFCMGVSEAYPNCGRNVGV